MACFEHSRRPGAWRRRRQLLLGFIGLLVLMLSLSQASQRNSVSLYGGGTYAPGDEIRLTYYYLDYSSFITVYRVGNPEQVLAAGGPQSFAASESLELEPVRRLRVSAQPYSGQVTVRGLEPGVYFAQIGARDNLGATLILVTELSMVSKTDQDTVLVYSADSVSGEPRRALTFLLRGGTVYAEGLANDDGLTEFDVTTDPNELVVAAKYDASWAYSDSYWQSWNVRNTQLYLHTDRPVYQPGQQVYFKGTARADDGLAPLAGSAVEVVVRDADYAEILRQRYSSDAYGSFEGELTLANVPPLGRYTVEATVGGETFYGDFAVEEYQKPEYRVTVSGSDEPLVQGDTARFVVAGEYLFGGPVAGGEVDYTVLRQPYYRYRYTSRYGFYQDDGYSYGGDVVARGSGRLDADGQLVVDILLEAQDEDYQLTVQAGVTDAARREIRGSADVVAYRSEVVIGVDTERYAYRTDEGVRITVRAEDLRGEPISVDFVLDTERYFWTRGRGRQTVAGPQLTGTTDASGRAQLELPLGTQGSYRLLVRAADRAGRTTTASDNVWVSDGSYWYWAYNSLDIEADRPEYAVGDVARFVITSPVEDAALLITREGRGLQSAEVVRLNGSSHTYELPITADMAPNSYLSATVIGAGNSYTRTAGIRVPPEQKFLNVEITSDNDAYAPGDVGTFRLRVSDASGAGVQAQVAIGLVDEAIYLIRPDTTPDIRGFFYGLIDNRVGTRLSDNFYFAQAAPILAEAAPAPAARAAMDDAVFGQSKGENFATAELRDDFRDTIVWLPRAETDAQGFATVEVTFPDNLTEWRLTARAITLGDEVGQNSYTVRTTLPVIARLAAPRFLVRGDETSLRIIGQNNLERDQQGRLEFSADGLETLSAAGAERTLPAGGSNTLDVRVFAAETGSSLLTATALTPDASDAMRVPLTVIPRGLQDEAVWAGRAGDTWRFTLPADTDPSSIGGDLYLTSSLAAAVSPALAYLAGYPYGCTEQTMSRFLPSVIANQAGQLARLPEDVEANLDDIVAAGLTRLYDFQQYDGGWGFWQYDGSSPFISAYVVSGLLRAREAGYPVRDWVLEDGLDYLEDVVGGYDILVTDSDKSYAGLSADAYAYAYYALAQADRDAAGLELLMSDDALSPYGLALGALALERRGETGMAEFVLDLLLNQVTERDQVAYWESGAERYAWNDDRIEATAYALQALVTLRPDEPIIGKVVNWLLLERRGARWVSTKDTAAVVSAALVLADVTGETDTDTTARVVLNGELIATPTLSGQASSAVVVPLSGALPGDNSLTVTLGDAAPLYASANVRFVNEQDDLGADSNGLSVARQYQRLEPTLVPEEGRYVYERQSLAGGVNVGDYLLVTVTVKPSERVRYLLVEEPIPAGFRVIENDQAFRVSGLTSRYGDNYYGWNYYYDGRDVRAQQVDYYFASLERPTTFTYILQAETPGTYTALPSQAWLMYDPEMRGNSPAERLIVAPEEVRAER
ncbi:MAG: MG2 domain-containing protein [Trueperaceae bacterium]|nr:MG2 domain-containing protein [Trueperaceae bacterium]